ncbi:MAG: hypothetical protein WBG43_02220 [Marinifilaceae bacterium]
MKRKISYLRFFVYIFLMGALIYSLIVKDDFSDFKIYDIVVTSVIFVFLVWAIGVNIKILLENRNR